MVQAQTNPVFKKKSSKNTHDICHLRKGDNDGGPGTEASHERMRHKAHDHLKKWRGDLIEICVSPSDLPHKNLRTFESERKQRLITQLKCRAIRM